MGGPSVHNFIRHRRDWGDFRHYPYFPARGMYPFYPYYGFYSYGYPYSYSYYPYLYDPSLFSYSPDSSGYYQNQYDINMLSNQLSNLQLQLQQLTDQNEELRQQLNPPAPPPSAPPSPAQTPPPSLPGAAGASQASPPATVLVFRDGHRRAVRNYAIVGQTLWILSETGAQKVPLANLDMDQTVKANEDRGIAFPLPSSPRSPQ